MMIFVVPPASTYFVLLFLGDLGVGVDADVISVSFQVFTICWTAVW
jgi:hypothetical protein